MTIEQKLEKCIEFLKKIEKMNIPTTTIGDMISVSGECVECGSEDVDVSFEEDVRIVEPKYLERLKDDAWHLLSDIS